MSLASKRFPAVGIMFLVISSRLPLQLPGFLSLNLITSLSILSSFYPELNPTPLHLSLSLSLPSSLSLSLSLTLTLPTSVCVCVCLSLCPFSASRPPRCNFNGLSILTGPTNPLLAIPYNTALFLELSSFSYLYICFRNHPCRIII